MHYLCCAPDIAAEGNILNVFSFEAVFGRDFNLSSFQQRAEACYNTVYGYV